MSTNCIDASIELSNEKNVPIMLIASRSQIDSEEFRGGYVNNWTTDDLAKYVFKGDKRGKIILARDHGGPWQNNIELEQALGLRMAIESAKTSYKADIDAGLQILHIDPSIDLFGQPDIDEILDRVIELYEFCWSYSNRKEREIRFEIGTEEQSGTATDSRIDLEYTLETICGYCKNNHIPKPLFVVVQIGTRVMETRNVGSFDSLLPVENEIPPEIQIPRMVELCERYGVYMKVHNTDYLSDDSLKWYPRLGIHSANIAPEFGVEETKGLIQVLEQNGAKSLSEEFLQMAYDSGKWKKWMLDDTQASDREKSIIAGHYVYAQQDFLLIKDKAEKHLAEKNIDLKSYLKQNIKKSILRYLKCFRLVR